ncbi:unnamed protein product [Arctia plantaginis]|uniref:Uncharacterized protein n=1 Tax=Arctia plantaginis TaxID=874455 RepID=A0A8S1BB98_ARCPL|nr:unnamed protein product [Arctia plantaginis]
MISRRSRRAVVKRTAGAARVGGSREGRIRSTPRKKIHARRQQNARYLGPQRADESPEQSQARRQQHAEYLISQRVAETPE